MISSTASSAYPSPPALQKYGGPSFSPLEQTTTNPSSMVDNAATGETNVDGVGILTYQRALDLARNAEGDLDPNVSQYLEKALDDIWANITAQPESYVLSKDEFAVFNFYAQRFEGQPIAQQAIDRYWRHASEPSATRN